MEVRDEIITYFPNERTYVVPVCYKSRIKDSDPHVPESHLKSDPMFLLKKKKRKKRWGHVASVCNFIKPKNTQARLKGEEAEMCVIRLLEATLKEIPNSSSLPSFVLHNIMLRNCEDDIVILHPRLGIILVEVKALTNPRSMSRVDEAALQLMRARDAVAKEIHSEAVRMVIILPNLKQEELNRTIGRCRNLDEGIKLLCGRDGTVYQHWLNELHVRTDFRKTYLLACERWVLPHCHPSSPWQQDSHSTTSVCSFHPHQSPSLRLFPTSHQTPPCSLHLGHFFYLLRARHRLEDATVFSHTLPPHSHVEGEDQLCRNHDAWLAELQRSVCCLERCSVGLEDPCVEGVVICLANRSARKPCGKHHGSHRLLLNMNVVLGGRKIPLRVFLAPGAWLIVGFCLHSADRQAKTSCH